MIRRRVAAWSAGLFAAAWLGIAVQLVSGHDPALSHSTTSTSVSSGVTSSNTSDSSGGSATEHELIGLEQQLIGLEQQLIGQRLVVDHEAVVGR